MARKEALVFVHRQVVICCHILQLCCSSYFSCPVLLAGMKTDCDFHSLKKKKCGTCWTSVAGILLSPSFCPLETSVKVFDWQHLHNRRLQKSDCYKVCCKSVVPYVRSGYRLGGKKVLHSVPCCSEFFSFVLHPTMAPFCWSRQCSPCSFKMRTLVIFVCVCAMLSLTSLLFCDWLSVLRKFRVVTALLTIVPQFLLDSQTATWDGHFICIVSIFNN